jgi:RNA-directed DNA polymerase
VDVSKSKSSGKSFSISKQLVWEAYLRVRANKGAPGVDGCSVEDFEADVKNNLYRLWNRMSSGSYFPAPVRAVEIPKSHGGGTRMLGVPTVVDRIAQTVVAMHLEERVEPKFHPDSYGYRTGRSALDAVGVCRERCWKFDWVIDLDIQKFFDSVDWDLIVKAVEANTDAPWVVLYVKRWLAAAIRHSDGSLHERDRGTSQGSPVSPVLANLFLHYGFDQWMARTYPAVRFERYVDDAVVHCVSRQQAETLRAAIDQRMVEVGLRLHPDKTRIVYCKDSNRRGKHDNISFTFLGYTFRPREALNKRKGVKFTSFQPAMSREKLIEKSREVRRWRIHRRPNDTLADIAREINPFVRGWMTYWGRFYRTEMDALLKRINTYLLRWARKKYKRLRGFKRLHAWWVRVTKRDPGLFAHWAWTHRFDPTGW